MWDFWRIKYIDSKITLLRAGYFDQVFIHSFPPFIMFCLNTISNSGSFFRWKEKEKWDKFVSVHYIRLNHVQRFPHKLTKWLVFGDNQSQTKTDLYTATA